MSGYKTQWMRTYRASGKNSTSYEITKYKGKEYRAGTPRDYSEKDWGNRKMWEGKTNLHYKVLFQNGTSLTVSAPDAKSARAMFKDTVIERVFQLKRKN